MSKSTERKCPACGEKKSFRLDQKTCGCQGSNPKLRPENEREIATPTGVKKLLLKDSYSVQELSEKLRSTPESVGYAIEALQKTGHNLVNDGLRYTIHKEVPQGGHQTIKSADFFDGKWHTFGAMGDTHLYSKHARLDVLNCLYDIYEREGITTVFHTGNAIDGEARFNKFDLVGRAGMGPQLEYFAQEYPQRKGITTKFITGDDHEGWYIQREGVNIGKMMQHAAEDVGRKDLEWIGHVEADIRLEAPKGFAWMRVMHPGGGSAYATSYTAQKLVESFQGGEKPQIMLIGHYHKLEQGYPREVHVVQTGCFLPTARITTKDGPMPIANIRVGDEVLTHQNRFRKVYHTMARSYSGKFYTICTGKSSHVPSRGTVTATAEHPFLTLTDWKPAEEIREGEWIAVRSKLAANGELIPWYRDRATSEIFKEKPNKVPKPTAHNELAETFAGAKTGEKYIPLTKVVPDGIVINWENKTVTAIEIERNRHCPNNPQKYDLLPPGTYSNVLWACTAKSSGYERRPYLVRDGNVFVQVKTVTEKVYSKPMTVFNISVEEDESYIAGNHVVHNCTQDQTTFMRKLKIQAHVGGTIIRFHQAPTGEITRFNVEFITFYDRNFYVSKDKYERWK